MLKCELDVMEYAITMESEMLDDEILLDETICELDDVLTEAEADEFIKWLYSDQPTNSKLDISNSELWKLCNSILDANFSSLYLTVFDDCENTVYRGIATDYPFDWFDGKIFDHSTYNIENKIYLDVWVQF